MSRPAHLQSVTVMGMTLCFIFWWHGWNAVVSYLGRNSAKLQNRKAQKYRKEKHRDAKKKKKEKKRKRKRKKKKDKKRGKWNASSVALRP